MAQAKITKDTNRFIKKGAPTPKSGQYVVPARSKKIVDRSQLAAMPKASKPSETDWEQAATDVLNEFDGAWKRLADL